MPDNQCRFCNKEKTYDPWCCKAALNFAVILYQRCELAYIYKITDGWLGKPMEKTKHLHQDEEFPVEHSHT